MSLIAIVVAGCIEAPATSLAVQAQGGGPPEEDEYVGQQGTLLLGFKDPDVRRFGFALPITGARVLPDGQVIADGLAGLDFIGKSVISFNETVAIEVRISNVIPPPTPDDKWQYLLEQPDGNGGWTPACAQPQLVVPPPAPLPSPPLAIAMPGRWSRDGLYTIAPSWITFACQTGVVAKCDHWGFPVTADPPDLTENGTNTSAVKGADMMQACTRMARADFCSGGVPNTLDGTPIHIDDVFRQPPSVPGYVFEGAWTGKAVNDVASPVKPVICLTKKRWSTLPLGGNCPLQLPDPRVDSKGTFCDDILKQSDLEAKGALVISSSTYIDAGLYTYTNTTTSTRFTTTNLQPSKPGQLPEWHLFPEPQVGFPISGGPVAFEATIFGRELPIGVPGNDLIQLHSYQCPSGDLVTTTSQPAGCTWVAREGHVYLPSVPGRAPLRRWYNTGTKRSHTTPTAPTTMIAAGWQLAEIVGGVIRAGIIVNLRWAQVTGANYQLDVQTRTGEWISPCVNPATIGSATSFGYRGACPAAQNRAVDHHDVVAFRVIARTTSTTNTGMALYDGVNSDAYVPVPTGKTTAVAISWNDAGPGLVYALDVLPLNGDWVRCLDERYLATGLSHVHTGACAASGGTIKLQKTIALRVCAAPPHDPKNQVCAETSYDGVASKVVLDLPSSW